MKTTLLLLSGLIAGLFVSAAASPAPFPYYAFCRTLWLFGLPCDQVGTKLVQQIRAFSSPNVCKKCHYKLISASNTSILANHTSPDNLHVENIELTQQTTVLTGSCRVFAQSTSLTYTTVLDGGVNYCDLHDLLTASGLSSTPGFTEVTNEWACYGYGLTTC